MSDWDSWYGLTPKGPNSEAKRKDPDYCDCYVPMPVDCSVFRSYWVCDKCGLELENYTMRKK